MERLSTSTPWLSRYSLKDRSASGSSDSSSPESENSSTVVLPSPNRESVCAVSDASEKTLSASSDTCGATSCASCTSSSSTSSTGSCASENPSAPTSVTASSAASNESGCPATMDTVSNAHKNCFNLFLSISFPSFLHNFHKKIITCSINTYNRFSYFPSAFPFFLTGKILFIYPYSCYTLTQEVTDHEHSFNRRYAAGTYPYPGADPAVCQFLQYGLFHHLLLQQ